MTAAKAAARVSRPAPPLRRQRGGDALWLAIGVANVTTTPTTAHHGCRRPAPDGVSPGPARFTAPARSARPPSGASPMKAIFVFGSNLAGLLESGLVQIDEPVTIELGIEGTFWPGKEEGSRDVLPMAWRG